MSYFYHKFSKEALNKAYELLEDVTPLEFNCGMLCNNKCCKGTSDEGMLLFPGEEEYFAQKSEFTVNYSSKYGCNCLVCNGSCNRADRPLSCRIFPFFLYIIQCDNSVKLSVAPDIRALDYCPLLYGRLTINKQFLTALRKALLALSADSEINKFLTDISVMLTDFNNFNT